MRNLYKVLGIASTADDRRIKSAFRMRAKAVHPDLNPNNARAESRFIELVEAYEVLRHAETRAEYDGYLAERRSEARRRFVHCAGLMAASFVLTAGSALFVMGLAGANVPYRETWQLAVTALAPIDSKTPAAAPQHGNSGWSTHVAVVPVAATPAAPRRPKSGQGATGDSRRAKVELRPVAAPSKAPAARSDQIAADTSMRQHKQQVAAAANPTPDAVVKRTAPVPPPASTDSWWSTPPAADEPRYSLGASDLR